MGRVEKTLGNVAKISSKGLEGRAVEGLDLPALLHQAVDSVGAAEGLVKTEPIWYTLHHLLVGVRGVRQAGIRPDLPQHHTKRPHVALGC
jgi:hypothetical protein